MVNLPVVVATIEKNATEEVRVVLDEFHGHHLCDARVFGTFTPGAEPKATRKGLSVRVDMLDDLIDGLTEAKAQAVALGWISA